MKDKIDKLGFICFKNYYILKDTITKTDWKKIFSLRIYVSNKGHAKYMKNFYDTIIRQTTHFKNGQKI